MSESRRSEFVKRLSTVGLGTRESIQVLLGSIVYDIREQVIHRRFTDDDVDAVVAFHDEAEALWRDTIATDPPLEPREMITRLHSLLDACRGRLPQFEAKLERGLRNAERFEGERKKG